jgi:phosphoribosylamine--glycine ligase
MMRILLVASSARGHAIADALMRSPQQPEIIAVTPARNPGIGALASSHTVLPLHDTEAIVHIAQDAAVDFAIIGPEDPLANGLADALQKRGIPSVAPLQSGARIESSKRFARDLMAKYDIGASPLYRTFTDANPDIIRHYIQHDLHGEYVVKFDALKGGKGVKVGGEHLDTVEDGVRYACDCIRECGAVVVEEKLQGVEFSLISFVSGTQVVHSPAVQDHKRAFTGDTGPNTGGMGTYSMPDHSLPFLDPQDMQSAKAINEQVARALLAETGVPYRGFLYGGFMAVRDGIRVIEYNSRLGDPEALNILPLLTSDFAAVCNAIVAEELTEQLVTFAPKATVCLYVTPKSYPTAMKEKGAPVTFPTPNADGRIFFGDISQDDAGVLRLGRSRTAGIVGIGDTLEAARYTALSLCKAVDGPVRFREDIGSRELTDARCRTMHDLRRSAIVVTDHAESGTRDPAAAASCDAETSSK